MAWARLDDAIFDNPKIAALSDAAQLAHIKAIVYCARNLTDGEVPMRKAREWATLKVIKELEPSLWEPTPTGYRVHDYLDYNPTRDEVKTRRQEISNVRSKAGSKGAANREAKRKQNGMQTSYPVPDPDPIPSKNDENLVTERTSISISEALDPHVSRETRSRGNGRALPGDHARVSAAELDERRKDEEWLARVDPETIKGTWTPEEFEVGRLDVRSRRLRSETNYVRPQNELPRLREVAG